MRTFYTGKTIFMHCSGLFWGLVLTCTACSDAESGLYPAPAPPAPAPAVHLLALGDSYTKGQGVSVAQSFPYQLADVLRARGKEVKGVRVIAQTGWRTDQLEGAILAATDIQDSVFGLVTLCIGVNNQYQKRDTAVYRAEFERLLQKALAFAGGSTDRVIVLSIPDWAYTPYGQQYSNPAKTSAEIDAYNAINREIAQRYRAVYLDVTGISRQGLARPGLVASDQLHPSGQQYALWVEAMMPLLPF
ncbi:MAG: SGNH/GDSL hydrolase family protein [Saprospiraceae bacterium]|nr:SGNH/GDSL hydrolase family protein [Saprospiraceae bacterium]